MTFLKKLIATSLLSASCSAEVLKIGGPIQTSGVGSYGKKAWELWTDWVNSNSNTTGFTVELYWGSSASIAEVVTNMTNKSICFPACVDVLLPPYGSGGSITAIGAISSDFTGPVMVWGGASDSIFTTHCYDKQFKCYGTFTTASNYMSTGINAIDGEYTETLTASLIMNNNAFSSAVCAGANETIKSGGGGITVHSEIKLSEKSSVPEADMAKVETLLADKPDIVILCGHNGFTEPIIAKIQSTYSPTAVIGTNTITSASLTKLTELEATPECVMMPTQWAAAETADSIIGWKSSDFKAAMPDGQATYHAASAAAGGIALTHAMAAGTEGSRIADLTTLLSGLPETASFYGPIGFNSFGNILKPMYTEQYLGDGKKIVAPASAAARAATHPLSTCAGWPTPAPKPEPEPEPEPSPSPSGPAPSPPSSPSPSPTPTPSSTGTETSAATMVQIGQVFLALAVVKLLA